ncbi:phosphinothricin acetyltransferase [Sphingomonas laterariae]|uniref:Phosphinothricin acetyltransferase n=1 Tax=Edaphosphingomonas laterariae TaxID=861865 RepID=A0A239KHY1_9SPHN|nr:arsinothricin resistance N-acetyltransferase ArsN1 family B [Sphingomonas laterariae]SNT17302.1 phosphinothricin acetyltransferase [Sphingomonas laterariae]
MGAVRLRAATLDDAEAIAAIYAPYVAETAISFEEEAPGADEMRRRIAAVTTHFAWFVAEQDGQISGYAYADLFRTRPAYRWAAETTVYVAQGQHGLGIGRTLYAALLESLRAQGYVTAIGAVTLPNPASAALHEAMGFTLAGTYRGIGFKHGSWHDVGIWQCDLAARPARPEQPTLPA